MTRDRDDRESRPRDMPSSEEARQRAKVRSGHPDANEMGTAATARTSTEMKRAEGVAPEPALDGDHGERPLRDRSAEEARSTEGGDYEVRSTYERHALGEPMDGERLNQEPPGRFAPADEASERVARRVTDEERERDPDREWAARDEATRRRPPR